MSMSQKDYVIIARDIKRTYERDGNTRDTKATLEQVAKDMATYMQAENPKFDRVRFLKACGMEMSHG